MLGQLRLLKRWISLSLAFSSPFTVWRFLPWCFVFYWRCFISRPTCSTAIVYKTFTSLFMQICLHQLAEQHLHLWKRNYSSCSGKHQDGVHFIFNPSHCNWYLYRKLLYSIFDIALWSFKLYMNVYFVVSCTKIKKIMWKNLE